MLVSLLGTITLLVDLTVFDSDRKADFAVAPIVVVDDRAALVRSGVARKTIDELAQPLLPVGSGRASWLAHHAR